MHTSLVAIAKTDVEDMPSHFWRKLAAFVAKTRAMIETSDTEDFVVVVLIAVPLLQIMASMNYSIAGLRDGIADERIDQVGSRLHLNGTEASIATRLTEGLKEHALQPAERPRPTSQTQEAFSDNAPFLLPHRYRSDGQVTGRVKREDTFWQFRKGVDSTVASAA